MKLSDRLAIQSWCFRDFKTWESLAKGLRDSGVSAVELCGVHLEWDKADAALAFFRGEGITINSCGVNWFDGSDADRRAFEFACKAGFPALSADFAPESVPAIEKLCAEYGKKLAVHNHGRQHANGSVAALEKLFAESSENIGLCLDTAWMLDSGEDPLAVAKKFRSRLYGMHLKDFVFDRAGRPEDVVVGTGNLDLKGILSFLKETDYQGYLTLEYEGDSANPVPALSECVHKIRASEI